jgi:outer membrane protein
MTRFIAAISIGILMLGFHTRLAALPESPEGKTFEDCYKAALKRSELVAQQAELIRQAEDNYKALIGSIIPNITGYGSYQLQQQSNNAFSTIYPNPSTSTRLTLTQPLFQGFKEFAGLRQGKSLVHASQYDRKQAAVQLYMDTAASFFSVVSFEHDIDNVIDELGFYDKRIAELRQFRAIGRSQVTDVLTAESQKAALVAQLKQIQGQYHAQRAILSFLTGFAPNTPVRRPSGDQVPIKPLDAYLGRVDLRPDVRGDSTRAKASEEGIPIARAGHLPTISVTGDYYLQRTGALSDVSWDVMLNVALPIFSGGSVQAQLETAVAKRDQADLQVSRTKGLALQQIRQFYETFVGDRDQYEAYREAVAVAEKNYKEELREYRLGLVTNLDVLTALTAFQESKRSFDKARYSMMNDVENLEAAGAFKLEQISPQ